VRGVKKRTERGAFSISGKNSKGQSTIIRTGAVAHTYNLSYLGGGSSRPVETLSQLRKKKGWLWWHTPVVPAT
jgi:hypothetical protein